MKLILILLSVLVGQFSIANVGFAGGNQRKVIPIEGRLSVTCFRPGASPEHVYYNCYEEIMSPTSYDYFLGPQGLSADSLELTSVWPDGSSRSKTTGYDSQKFRSATTVNLWILTLLQRPLLQVGENKVSYTLKQSGTTVGQGQIQVNVEALPLRTCPDGQLTAHDDFYCRSEYSACSDYFQSFNYCK